MATAKIATLAIRTLAKPIATQLKSQAAQHESFKKICIALAQRMHRTEMALRTNLLPNGVQQKVRPLNDAKAIANGANAISEGFLFFVAAALILGETYRGSRKKAEQRDRTEEALGQLNADVERLASVLGIDLEALQSETERASSRRSSVDGEGEVTEESDPSAMEARLRLYREGQEEEIRNRQLQAAVGVLLNLALKNRWVAGQEALELEGILGRNASSLAPPPASAQEGSAAQVAPPQNKSFQATAPSDDSSQTLPPSIIQQVALERAKALAREVRGETDANPPPVDTSLASLLAQHRESTAA